jgi:hypothetical protein
MILVYNSKMQYERYQDKTLYPHIYSHVYWGAFKADEHHPEPSIIEARNKFITTHQIIKKYKNSCDIESRYRNGTSNINLDHQECYEDKLGRIVHIYSQHPANGIHKDFKLIRRMYSPSQITGLRIIETTKSKKQLFNRLLQKLNKLPDEIVVSIQQYLPYLELYYLKFWKVNL